jgi:hypothetical protein
VSTTGSIAGESQGIVFGKKCPQGTAATEIGFHVDGTGTTGRNHLNSAYYYPEDRRWGLFMDNLDQDAFDVDVSSLCWKGQFTRSTHYESSEGDPDGFVSATAKCPRGSSAAGGGGSTLGGFNESRVLQSVPAGKRGWTVRAFVSIPESSEQDVGAIVVCDRDNNKYESVTADGSELSRSHSDSARRTNIDNLVAHPKCPKGTATSGGGFDLGDAGINDSVLSFGPDGRRTWEVHSRFYGRVDPNFTATAVCRVLP